jgi:hypothetical protein
MVLAVGLAILLSGAVPAAAVNYLKDISVQKAADSIVIVVTTSEPCEYNTMLLSGKPERLVVDLQGVTNIWTTKKFMDLPFESLQSIRTSQFKREPLVTRVVLDVDREITYTVNKNQTDLVLKMPIAPGETEFAAWSAQKAIPAPAKKAVKKAPAPVAQKKEAKEETKKEEKAAEPTPPKKESAGVKIESSYKREVVRYRTSGYKDPFMPLLGTATGQLSTGLPVLENLVLVGILEDIDGNRALLEDDDGNGYILMPNDKVKNGYLVSVTDRKAIFQITEYGWTRTVALELSLPELR